MNANRTILVVAVTLVICLLIATGGAIRKIIRLQNDMAIWRDNLYQTLNERDSQIILQTTAEFRKIRPELDSIARANGIKHVTQVHNTTYHNHLDTIIYPMQQPDTNIPQFTFTVDTACYQLSGIVSCTDRTIQFNQIDYRDQITTFYYWQRNRLFSWSWTPRWGRKQYRAKTISTCTDSITTEQITIKQEQR